MIKFIEESNEIKSLYISKETLNKIINDFKDELIKNKSKFNEMYKIDSKFCNTIFELDKIITLLDEYKNEKINEEDEKKTIIASYYGNPYITINLCIKALVNKKSIVAITEDSMLAVNTLIVSMFNRCIGKIQNKAID